jgi:hypothetical protein
MLRLIITLDYELPYSRKADVRDHVVKPTQALLDICQKYGAKLTVMAEMAEVWAMEKKENAGFQKFLNYDGASEIRRQLGEIIRLGHDVQLHLHPQWLGARWSKNAWELDFSKYRLTDFDYEDMVKFLYKGKKDLEAHLQPISVDYACLGFRSGNWNTQPSGKYLRALQQAGLKSDTSVFKWGHANIASARFDYRTAYSNLMPWFASGEDINRPAAEGILEFPIYSEPVSLLGMFGIRRLSKALRYIHEDRIIRQATKGSACQPESLRKNPFKYVSRLFNTYSKKLDFCKLSGKEMLKLIKNIHRKYYESKGDVTIPIVMIGHSKELDCCEPLEVFLNEASNLFGNTLGFATYRQVIKDCLQNQNNYLLLK